MRLNVGKLKMLKKRTEQQLNNETSTKKQNGMVNCFRTVLIPRLTPSCKVENDHSDLEYVSATTASACATYVRELTYQWLSPVRLKRSFQNDKRQH